MWAKTITHGRKYEEDRDAPRFRDAFLIIANRHRRWPAPVDFLEAMPRTEPAPRVPLIENDKAREVGMRHIADLAARLKIEPVKPHTEVADDSAA